jgi:hypothetical protein
MKQVFLLRATLALLWLGTTVARALPPFVPSNTWHVNDNSTIGDSFTSAVGNDANDGSAGAPFRTIQYAVSQAAAGDVIKVDAGLYDELVVINKALTVEGTGTASEVTFTGTVPGGATPTLFKVEAADVTVKNLKFTVNFQFVHSGLHTSGDNRNNLAVIGNTFVAIGTAPFPGAIPYGRRNAIAINPNISGIVGYAQDPDGFTGVVVQGNTVQGTGDIATGTNFRAAIQMDLCGGTIGGDSPSEGNTFTSINHDVNVRFCNQGNVTVKNNTCLGGGIQAAEFNAGLGTLTIANNSLTGANVQAASGALPTGALLRLQNNQVDKVVTVSNNTFTNFRWAASVENFRNVTFDNNTFTPKSGATDYRHISFNTKLIASTSATITMTTVGATLTNNTFNGSGANGGTGLTFFNHRNDSSIGTYTLGTAGNENTFGAGMSQFIRLDNSTGASSGFSSPFNDYASAPSTTMGPWAANLDAYHNKFDVGTGAKIPSSMSLTERTSLENALFHKPDDAAVGLISYFYPVRNVTQNTLFSTIGAAIAAAASGDVIELKEWTFNERVVIDKSLTLQGVDRYRTILDGTGLMGEGSGITVNNGVTNVTIKKMVVKNFIGVSPNQSAGIFAALGNNNLTVDEVSLLDNLGGSGFYANGPVSNVSVTKSRASGHVNYLSKGVARGMVIWNGLKSNITFSQDSVLNNGCCGIELQDGSASGVTITNNVIKDNADNGIGLVGLTGGNGANLISGNTVENNGRFGIEIKNPNGNGATSGDGSIVVQNNTVTRNGSLADVRDWAGIAVFRRSVLSGNADFPKGVVVQNNTVTGATQPSSAESFGIVIEGVGNKVLNNTVSGWEVGIQEQGSTGRNHPNDADQTGPENDQYFSRGNAQIACSNTVTGNSYGSNGTDFRQQGVVELTATASNGGPYATGTTIELSAATPTPGRTLASYEWTGPDGYSQTVTSNPATRANAQPSHLGAYNVTVTDQFGCKATASTNVVVCFAEVSVTGGGLACTGPTAPVTFNLAGTAPLTLVYSSPSGNVTVSNLTGPTYTIQAGPGTYGVVSLTDANGCTASSTSTVSVIAAGITSGPTVSGPPVCAGQNITLDFTSGCTELQFTAQLSNSGGSFANPTVLGTVVSGSNTLQLPSNLPTGNQYRIRLVSASPALTSASSAPFTINGLNVAIANFPSTPNRVCQGDQLPVTFSTTGSCPYPVGNTFTVQLSNGSGSFANPTVLSTNATPGTTSYALPQNLPLGTGYRVRVISSDPVQTVNSAPFEVRGPSLTGLTPGVGGVPVCRGSAVTVSFTLAAGSCPFPGDNVFTAQLSNATGQFTAPVSLGTVVPGQSNSLTIPVNTTPGTGYRIRVVSSNPALTSGASIPFRVNACPTRMSAEAAELVVSPNPVSGRDIRVRVSGLDNPEFGLTSVTGRSLGVSVKTDGSGEFVLTPRQTLPVGVYVLQASQGTTRLTTRVLVTD